MRRSRNTAHSRRYNIYNVRKTVRKKIFNFFLASTHPYYQNQTKIGSKP